MTLSVTHSVVATGSNDGSKQVSKNAWNDDHVLTGDYIRKATVNLSSADILALNGTPVQVVAAPGAGHALIGHMITAHLTFGTVAYTLADSVDVGTPAAVWRNIGPVVSEVATTSRAFVAPSSQTLGANQACTVSAATSDPTLGDGTLTVTVWYSIEDVP